MWSLPATPLAHSLRSVTVWSVRPHSRRSLPAPHRGPDPRAFLFVSNPPLRQRAAQTRRVWGEQARGLQQERHAGPESCLIELRARQRPAAIHLATRVRREGRGRGLGAHRGSAQGGTELEEWMALIDLGPGQKLLHSRHACGKKRSLSQPDQSFDFFCLTDSASPPQSSSKASSSTLPSPSPPLPAARERRRPPRTPRAADAPRHGAIPRPVASPGPLRVPRKGAARRTHRANDPAAPGRGNGACQGPGASTGHVTGSHLQEALGTCLCFRLLPER